MKEITRMCSVLDPGEKIRPRVVGQPNENQTASGTPADDTRRGPALKFYHRDSGRFSADGRCSWAHVLKPPSQSSAREENVVIFRFLFVKSWEAQ